MLSMVEKSIHVKKTPANDATRATMIHRVKKIRLSADLYERYFGLALFDLRQNELYSKENKLSSAVWTGGELNPHAQRLKSNAKPLPALTNRSERIMNKNELIINGYAG